MKQIKNKPIPFLLFGIFVATALIGIFLFKPAWLLFKGIDKSSGHPVTIPDGFADDVSCLNFSPVDTTVSVHTDSAALLNQIKSLINYAREKQLKISIAGARHSMGGHTISPNGVRINMLPYNRMKLDTLCGILNVGSGALWSEVIPYLNEYGRSVHIMQSDNAFSVGGSISVNCHGWQHNNSPIASSVKSFRLLKADGKIVSCSREENSELFSLALGGYGLFGIILDVDIQTVPNEIYSFHRVLTTSENYLNKYEKYINENPSSRMVYGRLSVNEDSFLQKAMLNFFEYEKDALNNQPLVDPGFTELKRAIFQASKEDDYGKEMRWNSEQVFTKTQIGSLCSRNQIMNESPSLYLNRDTSRTDILHEYFIPKRNFNLFIKELQNIIPQHEVDLLNVTVRNVYEDKDSYLRYAREEVFAFVMFFNQERSEKAEKEMSLMTKKLINAAIKLDGVYYLPYRLHASPEHFHKSYPMAKDFFIKKNKYDPEGIFSNMFWEKYGN